MPCEDTPKCPKCKSNEWGERVPCRCMSCPPWICKRCIDPNSLTGRGGWEFYEEEL